ncbi:plant self-incompatibility S1 [Tanacetum coccineum]
MRRMENSYSVNVTTYDKFLPESPNCDQCVLQPKGVFDWHFCPADVGVGSVWTGEFIWASKYLKVDVYSKRIARICYKYKLVFGTQRCYWSVRSDALYASRKNSSFPGTDWHYVYEWP